MDMRWRDQRKEADSSRPGVKLQVITEQDTEGYT